MPRALTGNIVLTYLEKYPNIPALTLAKKIYKENSRVFHNVEHARGIIRAYLGLLGEKMKNKIKIKKYFREPRKAGFTLPEPKVHFADPSPYEPKKCKTLIIGDIHCPYYDKGALETALNYGINHQCKTLLINGDFLDHYSFSRWEKDPRKRDPEEEYRISMSLLKTIRPLFRTVIYKKGNHDQWFDRYLQLKAPELFSIADFTFESFYKLEELDITLVEDWRIIKYGRLNIIHGHEYKGGIQNPVGAARGLFLKSGGTNALCNHFHQKTEFTKNTLDGRIVGTWSVGCLCGIQEYNPHGDQQHGFAVLSFDREGQFLIDNKKVIKKKIY